MLYAWLLPDGNHFHILEKMFPEYKFTDEDIQKRYRRYIYEAGAVNQPEKGKAPEKYAPLSQVNSTGQAKVIDDKILEKERNREFELSRSDRFRYRTRYFTDSGIIGTKEFVSENYRRFKGVFMSKREKIPRRVAGLDGVYSLKRLTE
jgi:putative transposase